MQIWSLRIWRRRLFARTAWNGCRRGRFKRERALRRERERDGGRDGSRDPRDRARERGHTNPKSHSKSNRKQKQEREGAQRIFSRAQKKYIYEERHSNPPRGPLDATLKIEIERRHRAKDESNDSPRESQQSTIRQTFVLSYSLCVREMLRAFSRSMGFSTFRFDTPPPLFFFNQPRDPKHISGLFPFGGLFLTERGRRNHFLL